MHIGSLPWYIRGFMRHLEGKVVDGDVIIHNHPYFGASHTPDIAVAVPIFYDGELLGFAAVTAHVLDVGGSFPGSTQTPSTSTPRQRSTTGCAGTRQAS